MDIEATQDYLTLAEILLYYYNILDFRQKLTKIDLAP